jgi:hypothetical protein
MNRNTGKGMYLLLAIVLTVGLALVAAPLPVGADGITHPLATPFEGKVAPSGGAQKASMSVSGLTSIGDVVDMNTVLARGANYLKHAQADVTEDNAGNGNPDTDPNDGGWDWVLTSPVFTHSATASPVNLYGVAAMGLYYAYLKTPDAGYMTAMQDAATHIIGDPTIRSASDLIFLMRFQDLPGVMADIYKAAAKSKFDARIAAYGTATAFAQYIRDNRAVTQGYKNGIVPWSIGGWAVAAQMLEDRYPADVYDYAQAADDIAEVLWQDSFNNNPGYFVPGTNNGWDPTNTAYWWYSLGITGLLDAFEAANVHTAEIPGLVTILLHCQYAGGAFSGSYGANTGDEDWQSTAYAVMSLARVNRSTYQTQIKDAAYWLGATQDVASGGWVYSSDGTHYPEVGGENTSALYFALADLAPVTTNPLFCVGEKATVSIALNNVSNLYGYQFKVNYSNPALVSAVGAFDNSFFDKNGNGAVPPLWNGACAAGVCPFAKSEQGDPAVSGSGTVATVEFTGIQAGALDVTITEDILSDRDGMPISHVVGGPVHLMVCGFASASGTVSLQGRATPGGVFLPPDPLGGSVTLTTLTPGFGPYSSVINPGTGAWAIPAIKVMPGGTLYTLDATYSLYLGSQKTHTFMPGEVYAPPLNANTRLSGGNADNLANVTIADLGCIAGVFGLPPGLCGLTGSSDINWDGVTNILDLALAGGNFMLPTPQVWPLP